MDLICVDKENCRRDGICMAACPVAVIEADAEGYPVAANPDNCIDCGHCAAVCPHGALSHSRLPAESFLLLPRERAGLPELTNLMRARRSVRQYKDEALPRETLAGLLEVARIAPTAKNTQQLGYIVLETPATTRTLGKAIGDWLATVPGMERYARLAQSGRDFVMRGAPHVIIALGDADNDWRETDAGIALTYVELAAAAQGLGVCWAGIVHRALANNPGLAAMVGVPEGRAVCGALMIGAPRLRYALVPPRKAAKVSWL